MRLTKRFSVLHPATILLIAAFSAFAQTNRPDFNRPQTFDAQHYIIRASFDRSNKGVYGDATVSLKPLKADFRTFELDAVDLSFEWVKLEPSGVKLHYKVLAGKIAITLDKAYGPNDLIAVRLKYTASPKKGVYFVAEESGSQGVRHSSQIWTQGEPDEARHWFPSFDFPSDKATTEQYLTVDEGETVIGNGEFLGKTEEPNGKVTWHFKMPVPHSVYLVSFVIGKYVKIEDEYNGIPLNYYVYPGKESTGRKAFGETPRMMSVFEDLVGFPFPYNKYDQTMVAGFQFGGMENITATTMADTEILFADFDFGKNTVTDLVSHELAHSWFGDLVTCKNWAELWLNEGFATYMEAVYREKVNGRGDYMRKIRSDATEFLVDDTINRRRHALYNQRAGDVNSLFDNAATTYHKGGVVLHMLREQVGDVAFWKGVNAYLTRHKFASVESTDLKKAMEETSGQDLEWFFEQWVYGGGAPRIDVKTTYSSRTKTLTMNFAQTQLADSITPSVFRLPLAINIKTSAGDITQNVDLTKRQQTVSVTIAGKPSKVIIDEAEKIPLKRLKIRPMVIRR